jgi:hypothetical protein
MGRKKTRVGNCSNGCNKPIHARSVCRTCYSRINYEENERERRGAKKHESHPLLTTQLDKSGYVRIKIGTGSGCRDWVKYHRYVMEQFLQRKLFSFENVHHKNGNRADNRIENLELWVTKQPKGQRPEDLVEYANWILKTYNN